MRESGINIVFSGRYTEYEFPYTHRNNFIYETHNYDCVAGKKFGCCCLKTIFTRGGVPGDVQNLCICGVKLDAVSKSLPYLLGCDFALNTGESCKPPPPKIRSPQ